MNILILTGKFGMGHWSASQSLRQQLLRAFPGAEVEVLDFVAEAMPNASEAMYKCFNLLVTRGSGLFNLYYKLTQDLPADARPLFETIFSELPILAWEPFLEQEKNNARFLVKRGLGRVAAKEPEECLSAIRALIYDDETLEWMAGNMRAMKGQMEEESLNRMLAGLEAEKGVRVG